MSDNTVLIVGGVGLAGLLLLARAAQASDGTTAPAQTTPGGGGGVARRDGMSVSPAGVPEGTTGTPAREPAPMGPESSAGGPTVQDPPGFVEGLTDPWGAGATTQFLAPIVAYEGAKQGIKTFRNRRQRKTVTPGPPAADPGRAKPVPAGKDAKGGKPLAPESTTRTARGVQTDTGPTRAERVPDAGTASSRPRNARALALDIESSGVKFTELSEGRAKMSTVRDPSPAISETRGPRSRGARPGMVKTGAPRPAVKTPGRSKGVRVGGVAGGVLEGAVALAAIPEAERLHEERGIEKPAAFGLSFGGVTEQEAINVFRETPQVPGVRDDIVRVGKLTQKSAAAQVKGTAQLVGDVAGEAVEGRADTLRNLGGAIVSGARALPDFIAPGRATRDLGPPKAVPERVPAEPGSAPTAHPSADPGRAERVPAKNAVRERDVGQPRNVYRERVARFA